MADDDADDQYLVKKAVSEINAAYRFSAVQNGQELLQRLAINSSCVSVADLPDCVLLDLNMPLIDGFGVLQQIRRTKPLLKLPVFVLSTSRLKEDREKSVRLGADGFYVKPPKYPELRSILSEICNKACAAHPLLF